MARASDSAQASDRALAWRRIVPYVAVPVLGCVIGSVRTRWCDTEHLVVARAGAGAVIFAFWHENLLHFAWSHRRRGIRVMISRHGDGELIAGTVGRLGFLPVRGSSTRGGAAALRTLTRGALAQDGEGGSDLAITPDGPRGPRHAVQGGIIDLAERTGLPIVPATVAYARCWRAGSWDRMAVPWPLTRAVVLFGAALTVNADDAASASGRETQRLLLEQRMRAMVERAEREFDELYRTGVARLVTFDPK